MMREVIRKVLLRRQHLTKNFKELQSESEIAGGALSSKIMRKISMAGVDGTITEKAEGKKEKGNGKINLNKAL